MRMRLEQKREVRRGAVTLAGLGLLVGTLLLLVALGLKLAADRSDEDARRREAALASNGLSLERDSMLRELKAFAVWDEAVASTSPALNDVFVHANFGQYVYDTYGHDRSFVLGTDDRPVYASANGEVASPRLYEHMRADLAGIVGDLRRSWGATVKTSPLPKPATFVGYRTVTGRPALVAAATIVSDTGRLVPSAEGTSVAVSVKFLDGPFASRFGAAYLLRDFAVSAGVEPEAAAMQVAIPTAPGQPSYHAVWNPDRPGRRMLEQAVPPLSGGLLVIAGLAGLLVGTARRANRRLARSEQRAHTLAYRDPLTGRANRPWFVEALGAALKAGGPGHIGVIYVDIDGFKELNDTLGHAVGDELLRLVSERLHGTVRSDDDLVARFGGDEFAIMITALGSPGEVAGVCRRVSAAFQAPFLVAGQAIAIGAAVGAAVAPDHGDMPIELMRRADIALHRAKKKESQHGWLVFEPAYEEAMVQRRSIDQDLRHAIERQELAVYYQPQYAACGERLVGYEALVRWHHPTRGLVSPADFVPIAEETGLILQIDEWVLETAMRAAAGWGNLTIAVNLSPLHFRTLAAADRIRRFVAAAEFPPRRLELEVTENVFLNNAEAFGVMEALRGQGIRLALDDFGSGYSSLGYVRRFVFDKIKIDKGFVQSVGVTDDATAIVECVARLGRALGITVTAEGVENGEQHRFVRACGCHQVQGYLFGTPLPEHEAAELALAHVRKERRAALRVIES